MPEDLLEREGRDRFPFGDRQGVIEQRFQGPGFGLVIGIGCLFRGAEDDGPGTFLETQGFGQPQEQGQKIPVRQRAPKGMQTVDVKKGPVFHRAGAREKDRGDPHGFQQRKPRFELLRETVIEGQEGVPASAPQGRPPFFEEVLQAEEPRGPCEPLELHPEPFQAEGVDPPPGEDLPGQVMVSDDEGFCTVFVQ